MVTVVLPAYNEEEGIVPLLGEIERLLKDRFSGVTVVVVDDGSTDGTVAKVRAFAGKNVRLLEHGTNRGLSEAIKTGLLEALRISSDKDVIVTMDADNTHCPGLIFRMGILIDEGNDVVIGSRYVSGARVLGLTADRKLLSLGASLLLRALFPIKNVRDYTSGYRAYRASVLREASRRWGDDFISESGFACMVDILLKLRRMPIVMNEVPLILRYDQKVGASKMHVGRTIGQTLAIIAKRLFGG